MKDIKMILKPITDIEARIPDGKTFYTDRDLICHNENPGMYSRQMTRAMAGDMRNFTFLFLARYPKFVTLIADWPSMFMDIDHSLIQTFDDRDAGRSLTIWDSKAVDELMKRFLSAMKTVKPIYDENRDKDLKMFLDCCKIWAIRLMYMDVHAFVLHELCDTDQTLRLKILDERQKKISDAICSIRRYLAHLLVRIPVATNDHKYLMERLLLFKVWNENIIG